MIPSLLMLALLTVTDPVNGPAGADTLTAPTSAMYRNLAPFDIQEVAILDEETLELRLSMGSWSNPLGLENGFSHPIIEIYVGGGESGSAELLPGSGMVLPDGETWTVALQLTGDRARGWHASSSGVDEFEPVLQFVDDHLYVLTGLDRIEEPRLAAISGLYSPFHQSGWRPVEATESAWAFSGPAQQFPVVDVLALNQEAQSAALTGGVLPVTEVNLIENPNTVWFALMAAGIAVAGVGLVLRGFGAPAAARPAAEPDDELTEDGAEIGIEPEVGGESETEPAAARLSAVLAADSEEQARRDAAVAVGDDSGDDSADDSDSAGGAADDDAGAAGDAADDDAGAAVDAGDESGTSDTVEPVFEEEEEDDTAVEARVALFRGADQDEEPDDLALPEFGGVDFSEVDGPDSPDAAGQEIPDQPDPAQKETSEPSGGSDDKDTD